MDLFSWLYSLIILFFFFFVTSLSSPSPPPLCHPHESSALLNFRNSFTFYNNTWFCMEEYGINNPNNTISWNKNMDCCRWSGVTCDEVTAHVIRLDLTCSGLQGILHSNNSLFSLAHLQSLILSYNYFTGQVPLELSHFSNLVTLDLRRNYDLKLETSSWKRTLANLTNLRELFLRYVDMSSTSPDSFMNLSTSLTSLDLSNSDLQGKLPENVLSLPNLQQLYLSYNPNLNGSFLQYNWSSPLKVLNLSESGVVIDLPHLCRKFNGLQLLDLSNNNLSGNIPPCLGNSSLFVLDLHKNKLHGIIPSHFPKGNHLQVLNLNENQLEGSLPKSLLNCKWLEFLDIGNNKINGSFPWWLESFSYLQVLILRSNRFQGPIGNPKVRHPFHNLRIMDLSGNEFTGHLPQKYFKNFLGMMNATSHYSSYMQANFGGGNYYEISSLTIKGYYAELEKIQTMLIVIDFSRNNFTGEIPELLGKLNSLKGLNFSHNKISDSIPPSLGNLTNLEWLDLSSNKLVGKIPSQLAANLNQLQFLNLSVNELDGLIPRSRQFDTFTNDSYKKNLGLCGFPISESCNETTTHQFQQEDDEEHVNGFDWKIVLMEFGSGMVIGISMGYMFLSDKIIDGLVKTVKGE
ncbi:receptor-like protein 36 [Humulus lupulus]|uniref:receptor-like protein 36 n=1 Tax=Humulus lupulus TaxID=3486 RepID=UPI002B40B1DD|nr:receptor-like protein 36 [Humulus lupulus]